MPSIEQKDPLLIYKLESFNLFKEMVSNTNKEICSYLFKGNIPQSDNQNSEVKEAKEQKRSTNNQLKAGRDNSMLEASNRGNEGASNNTVVEEKPKLEPIRVGPKVGRNDPCPCGSGKKFKSCHGKEELV